MTRVLQLLDVKGRKYYADAYDEVEDVVYEFLGVSQFCLFRNVSVFQCYYHGCIDCYPNDDTKLIGGKTARQLRKETDDRIDEISCHYEVAPIKECVWKLACKTKGEEAYEFVRSHKVGI